MLISLLAAFAAPNAPDNLTDYWDSVRELRLHDDLYRRIEKPITLRDGAMTVTLTEGYLVPIFSGRFGGEWDAKSAQLLKKLRRQDKDAELPGAEDRGTKDLVGFLWTKGKGTVVTTLEDRGDAVRFANFMVHRVGVDAASMASVPTRKSFTTNATEGLFLSIDPRLEKRFLAQGGSTDPYEIVVYEDDDPGPALQRARTLFENRVKIYDEMGANVVDAIAWDRTAEARGIGDSDGSALLFDVHTTDRYGRVNLQKAGSPAEDEWLSLLRDDNGWLGRWRSQVLSVGRNAGGVVRFGRISGALFPTVDKDDPAAERRPASSIEPVLAKAELVVQPAANGLVLDVEIQTELTLQPVGSAAQWFEIQIPRAEATTGTFELLEAIDANGVDLLTSEREVIRIASAVADVELPPDDRGEDDEDADIKETREKRSAPDPTEEDGARVRLFLPEPVAAGTDFKVRIKWKDTWPLQNTITCSAAIQRPAGASSGLQDFLPSLVNGQVGSPWRFQARISVPEASKLHTAMSGVGGESVTKDGWVQTSSEQLARPARFPGVAVGRWQTLYEPGEQGLPAVRTHLLQAYPGQLESFAPETRRVIDYYQRWMPAYPVEEVEIFEAPAGCYGYTWVAPHGLVNVQRMITGGETRGNEAHVEHATYSHELAHQYWGHLAPAASIEDFWIAETFSEGFACMYVGAAFKPRDCERKMDNARRYWERDLQVWGGVASLTDAYSSSERGQIVYEYGPYVFHEMLRRRIGVEAYFGALDLLLRDHGYTGITTERLKAYFEAASGRDLTDFFDYWVYQGLIPAVQGGWKLEKGIVRGSLTSDIPFGTFDIPVVVTEGEHTEAIWVQVVNGAGPFEIPGTWKKPKVELDPAHGTLARKRSLQHQKK